MINHPNRSAAKVEIMTVTQSLSHVYLDRHHVGSISNRDGNWMLWLKDRPDRALNVSGIYHRSAEINQAVRLFVAQPDQVAAVWPPHGNRAQCKDALAALAGV